MMAQYEDTCPSKLKKIPDGKVQVKDDHGLFSIIKKLRSGEPIKGLGCKQAVYGSMKVEFEYRKQQCTDLVNKIVVAKLTCNETHLLIQSRILKTIAYSMPVTCFSKKQCRKLKTITDRVILNKYQRKRNTPKTVVYSLYNMRGMN